MTGPATPGQEGPSYAPPQLPEGWIAQWDGMGRKYYFVQLSTGASQWETPTQAAPTGPTPQATPQGIEHPYGTPGNEQHAGQPADGDRSLGGNIGSFAMNQLMGGGKKPSHGSSNNSGLVGMASSFLGSGGKQSKPASGGSQAGLGGILGGVAGSLLGGGGKKPNQQAQPNSYSGAPPQGQSHGGGFMDNIGGMFGGGSHGQPAAQANNYGYSQHNSQQGGYTGAAPPTSYQPGGAAGQYNAPTQHSSTPSQPQYGQNQPPHSQPSYQSQDSSYGAHAPQPQHPQQPQYGGAPQPPYSPPYQQPQHQDSYGGPNAPSQQYPGPPNYGQPGQQYGQGPPPSTGNLAQPQHGQYDHTHSGGLYGNSGTPQVPHGSHPGPGAPQYGAPPQQGGGRW